MKPLQNVDSMEGFLIEYLELQEHIKPLVKRVEELREWCKKQGSFSTDNYVCSIEPRTRIGLISKEEAIEIFTEEGVRSLGLLKESMYSLVHVSKKPAGAL